MLDTALTQTHHSIPAIMLSILQTHNQPVITTGIVQTGVTFIRWQMWFLEAINHHNQSNTDVYITASRDLLANTLFPSPSKTHTHTHAHTHTHTHTHTHKCLQESHASTHACMHIHTHTHTGTHSYTCIHTFMHMHIHTHTRTHTHTQCNTKEVYTQHI